MSRVQSSSSASTVGIKDTAGNALTSTSGALDVNVVSAGSSGTPISLYNEVTSVAAGVLTTILIYTVPAGKSFYLIRVEVSGTNIAEYTVQFNSGINSKKRTFYGNLNELFDYWTGGNIGGFPLVSGTALKVTTKHNRPFVGDFNARIQGVEV